MPGMIFSALKAALLIIWIKLFPFSTRGKASLLIITSVIIAKFSVFFLKYSTRTVSFGLGA